jgi:hypothetical protein
MSNKKTAYKAFNKDWTCRDFKYEVNTEYSHEGKIELCNAGFHSCENPFDVLNYYNLCDSNFAEVELSGEILEENDSKYCSSKIYIKLDLGLKDFIKACIDFQFTNWATKLLASSGDHSQAQEMVVN